MGVIEHVRRMLFSPWTGASDLRGRFSQRSYAQEGEDLLLRRFLNVRGPGFYVDIGAHHPMKFSNTYFYYRLGWSGINVDALPGSMSLFRKLRPRDVNIEAAISSTASTLTYTMFIEPALNTFDEPLARQRAAEGNAVVQTVPMHTRRLEDLLGEHVRDNQPIDFMSVDVEGLDLDVLKSNDWSRFRPTVVLAEASGVAAPSVREVESSEIHEFMSRQDYELVAKAYLTAFYRDRQSR